MAPSRCLPDPVILQRLLVDAGVRVSRLGDEAQEPDMIRFDEVPTPVAPPPAPMSARIQPPRPPAVPSGPPRSQLPRTPVSDFRIQEVRDAAPKAARSSEPSPLAEPSDQKLSDDVFGAQGRGLGVEQRLQKLVSWLTTTTSSSSAFVADIEGLPLVNRGTPEPYIVAIGPLARAQAEIARFVPDSPAGTSIVELDHQSLLEVVWADTAIGRLGVGVVVTEPLKVAMVTRIRRVAALAVVSRGDT